VFLNVIIPSYRAGKTILRTLQSIESNRANIDGEFDITVVDSTEPDFENIEELIAGSGIDVRFVKLPARAYPGKARNEGVRATDGSVICFVDADAYVDDNWLKSIHDYLSGHPDVAAVGGPVLNANPAEGYSRLAHWCEFSGYGLHAPEGERRVQPTVNVAIRREAFTKYGPFLEDQFGNEDVLLFNRMIEDGAKLHFSRTVRVYHRNKTKLEDIYSHQHRLGECTGRARVRYKLPGSFLTRPHLQWMIPIVKSGFIKIRLLTQETAEFPRFLISWPRVLKAMISFSRGFREGVISEKGEMDVRS